MAYNGTGYYSKKKTAAESENLRVIKARIKEKKPSGIYIFRGEEEYMKRFYYSELCKAAIDSDSNITVINSEDFSYEKLADAMTAAPAVDYSGSFFDDGSDLSDKKREAIRVIKLQEAPVYKLTEKEKNSFENLCRKIGSDVCVIFYYTNNPKKEAEYSKSIKILSKTEGILDVEFCREAPSSPQLKRWVKKHFEAGKCVIDAQSVDYFIETVGNDMCTLLSEIEKLCAYAAYKKLPAVYNEDIDFICIKNTEARLDEVAKGVAEGDYSRAMKALVRLEADKMPETYIFGAISNKISELYSVDYYKRRGMGAAEISAKTGIRDFAVKNDLKYLSSIYDRGISEDGENPCKKLVHIVAEYDIKLKTSPVNKYLLIENMIFSLCGRYKK